MLKSHVQLGLQTLWKYPATKDASAIARSLLHNVRNGSGDTVNIVEHTSTSQAHQIFHIEDTDLRKTIVLVFPNGNEHEVFESDYSFDADSELLKAQQIAAGQRWIIYPFPITPLFIRKKRKIRQLAEHYSAM